MITIIGNGESRATINVDNINGYKVGCNGIYLYHSVDLICAMDKFWREKITKESNIPVLSRHINNAFQSTLEIYDNNKDFADKTDELNSVVEKITNILTSEEPYSEIHNLPMYRKELIDILTNLVFAVFLCPKF